MSSKMNLNSEYQIWTWTSLEVTDCNYYHPPSADFDPSTLRQTNVVESAHRPFRRPGRVAFFDDVVAWCLAAFGRRHGRMIGKLPSVFGGASRGRCMAGSGETGVYEWQTPNQLEVLAWVKASERRVEILTTLADSPKNTKDFATDWDVSTEAVRYHLKQLREGGPEDEYPALVQVLTPKRRQYKLYGLTGIGAEIVESL